ncbi:MAG: SIMPL domain-containing protein [Lentisphaeria bacterium]|nr:SIMPL domain-containing protein [Lentisphaeria bacterium]
MHREIIDHAVSNDLRSRSVKITVREKKEYQELKILGYEVRRSISVTLRDLERFDTLMKFLLSTDNVIGTSADFDRSDREKIGRELLAAASEDAREEAERLAAGFGVQVQSVYAISEDPPVVGPRPRRWI